MFALMAVFIPANFRAMLSLGPIEEASHFLI